MPNFQLAYYKDPYLKTLDTEVLSCTQVRDHYEVVLADTIFYPEGGGQSGDTGFLNEVEVYDTHEKNDTVLHYTKAPLTPGEKVNCRIDFDRRFSLMQNHSGEHMVSGLIHQTFGYENIGFHMGDVVQIDFDGLMTYEDALKIEEKANALIQRNLPISDLFPSEEELRDIEFRSKKELSGTVRLVKIPEADLCACCGTHVKTTGEIGIIKILSCEKHKNGVRLEMLSGRKAYLYLRDIYNENRRISALLSAPPLSTSSYVEKMTEKDRQLALELNGMKEAVLKKNLESIPENQSFHLEVLDHFDRNIARKYANTILEEKKAGTVAILNQADAAVEYIILSREKPLRSLIKELNQKLNGRGGGSDEIVQGSFAEDIGVIEETLRNALS